MTVRLVTDPEPGLPSCLLIGVNSEGAGPVDHDHPAFDHWACWCIESHGRPVRIKWNGGRGAVVCPATDLVIWDGFPPGWKPGPAA